MPVGREDNCADAGRREPHARADRRAYKQENGGAHRAGSARLLDTRPPPTAPHPVIALHHNRDLVTEVLHAGVGNDQPGGPGQPQREMFILRVTIPFTRRPFENMRGWNVARWNTPPFALAEKSCLGLRAGEAELSRVLSTAPC